MHHLLKNFTLEVGETVFFPTTKLIINGLTTCDQIAPSIIDIALQRLSLFVEKENLFDRQLSGAIISHLRHFTGVWVAHGFGA